MFNFLREKHKVFAGQQRLWFYCLLFPFATLVRVSKQTHDPQRGYTSFTENSPLLLFQHFSAALTALAAVTDALQNSQDNEPAIPDRMFKLRAGRNTLGRCHNNISGCKCNLSVSSPPTIPGLPWTSSDFWLQPSPGT